MPHIGLLPLGLLTLALAALAPPTPAASADDAAPRAAPADRAKAVADLMARMKSKENDVRISAVFDAKAEQDPQVTAYLVHLLSDADAEVRKAAIASLGGRTEDAGKRDAANGIAARLPRLTGAKGYEDELFAAVDALHDLAQPSTLKLLADGLDKEEEPKSLEARLHAIANLPSAEAVSTLIDYLSRKGYRAGEGWWRQLIAKALVYATGEKYGSDPDSWRKWWYDHKAGYDVKASAERRAALRAEEKAKEDRQKKAKEGREGRKGKGRGNGMGEDAPMDGEPKDGAMGDGAMGDGAMGEGAMDDAPMGDAPPMEDPAPAMD